MDDAATNPLVAQVLSSETSELRILAAQGLLPLTYEELVELQVELAQGPDPVVAELAQASLRETNVNLCVDFVGSVASERALRYLALFEGTHPVVLDAIVRRRSVPRDLLCELARGASAELQESLLLRQDAIVESPEILDALEGNPRLSTFARRRIQEYREHLLPRTGPGEPLVVEEPTGEVAELVAEDLAAIERARALPAEGEVDERTGLTEIQIRTLPVPTRMKLTRGAGRTLRGILVRDLNAQVAVSVLFNSAFSEDEVEQIAASRMVVDEVLAAIERKREWISRYNVALNLARNPRTPVGTAVRLVARLSVRDLKGLARDRNVSDAVRSAADRLYRIKQR